MRKLKLGIIGTGLATNGLYWPQLKQLKSKIEIVAVANRRKAKAVAFAKLAGVKVVCDSGEELLQRSDIEAVVLSLPIELSAAWVIKALKAGKHVLCEKPLALNAAQGRKLIAQASKYKKAWLVGENYYFQPHIAEARAWFKAGKIGKPRILEAVQLNMLQTQSNPYYKTSWRQKPQYAGGFVLDAGVHISNIARELVGMPTVLKNFTARFNPLLLPIDTALGLMKFKGGVLGTWRSSFAAHATRDEAMITLRGSKGTLEIFHGRAVLTPLKGKILSATSKHDGFYAEFEHFYDVVVKGKKLKFTPKQALGDLEFIEQIVKA